MKSAFAELDIFCDSLCVQTSNFETTFGVLSRLPVKMLRLTGVKYCFQCFVLSIEDPWHSNVGNSLIPSLYLLVIF